MSIAFTWRFMTLIGLCIFFTETALSEPTKIKLFEVQAVAETEQAKSMEDAADDAEVWFNAAAPEKSVIFATDKKNGLFVLGLDGRQRDFIAAGRINNVDLRDDWQTSNGKRVLIGATNRTKQGVSLFQLNPETLDVTHDEASFVATDLADPYGFCMYRSAKSGDVSAIVIGKDGELQQFALTALASGVSAKLVRRFAFGSIAEGCVADDRTGILYVADELRGIWRLGAEPDTGDARELIAKVDGVELVADIEGVTLAASGTDGGYLIASIQGNSTYALFALPQVELVARFSISANSEKNIDAVTGTDGIAARLGNFGPKYPTGLLVVQDDVNDGAAQNFKLISWAEIMNKLTASN